MTTPQKYKIALEAINEFRTQYNDRSIINNKNDNKKLNLSIKIFGKNILIRVHI